MGKFSLKIPFQMFTVAIPQTKYSMNPPVKDSKERRHEKGCQMETLPSSWQVRLRDIERNFVKNSKQTKSQETHHDSP